MEQDSAVATVSTTDSAGEEVELCTANAGTSFFMSMDATMILLF